MEIIEEILPLSKNAKIIEIGSNDGSFLSELQRHGFKHTFGVEPAEDARRASHQKGIRTVGHYFNLHTAEQITAEWGKFDFIVVRQVLEHIEDLNGFQASLQRIVRPGGYILVEVPNFSFGLTAKDYSSIWEEHINYFCQPTLEKYLNDAGFSVIHHECAEFSGEAFIVLAQYDDDTAGSDYENQREWIYRQAKDFKACWPIFKTRFAAHLAQEKSKGARIALFGAGCRACSLINFTELKSYIELVVDDQPQKQGKYMPGSRLPIYDVSALYTYKIDTCLLSVNAENENAVLSKHKRYQEREGKFVSVNPPSRRLLPFWKQIQ